MSREVCQNTIVKAALLMVNPFLRLPCTQCMHVNKLIFVVFFIQNYSPTTCIKIVSADNNGGASHLYYMYRYYLEYPGT